MIPVEDLSLPSMPASQGSRFLIQSHRRRVDNFSVSSDCRASATKLTHQGRILP